jgi:hypothetical protein
MSVGGEGRGEESSTDLQSKYVRSKNREQLRLVYLTQSPLNPDS